MADIYSVAKRREIMATIRCRNTRPEIKVRSILHRLGYRFRLHYKALPGTPDIVLPRRRVIVLVHGCFWHRHPNCPHACTPKSRVGFWKKKFLSNIARDQRTRRQLTKLGWRVIVVWECQTRNPDRLANRLVNAIERK